MSAKECIAVVQQHATSMLYRSTKSTFDEGTIRDLVHGQPEVLPVGEIEPDWAGSVSLGVEIQTKAGRIDVLLVNEQGRLTIVETKLFKNPEGKRDVFAQVIDYAAALYGQTYENLAERVKQRNEDVQVKEGDDPLLKVVTERGLTVDDEDHFRRGVRESLELGRFLLLIVGERIRDRLEEMCNYLKTGSQLGFTLGLVELQHFASVKSDEQEPAQIWVPRVLGRMQPDLSRDWEPADLQKPAVKRLFQQSGSTASRQNSTGRTRLSESEAQANFDARFKESVDSKGTDFLEKLLQSLAAFDISPTYANSGTSIIIRYTDADLDYPFNMLTVKSNGALDKTDFLDIQLRKKIADKTVAEEIARNHYREIAKLLGDAEYKSAPTEAKPNRSRLSTSSGKQPQFSQFYQQKSEDQIAEVVSQLAKSCAHTAEAIQAAA